VRFKELAGASIEIPATDPLRLTHSGLSGGDEIGLPPASSVWEKKKPGAFHKVWFRSTTVRYPPCRLRWP
jgi:hypothetical protein